MYILYVLLVTVRICNHKLILLFINFQKMINIFVLIKIKIINCSKNVKNSFYLTVRGVNAKHKFTKLIEKNKIYSKIRTLKIYF